MKANLIFTVLAAAMLAFSGESAFAQGRTHSSRQSGGRETSGSRGVYNQKGTDTRGGGGVVSANRGGGQPQGGNHGGASFNGPSHNNGGNPGGGDRRMGAPNNGPRMGNAGPARGGNPGPRMGNSGGAPRMGNAGPARGGNPSPRMGNPGPAPRRGFAGNPGPAPRRGFAGAPAPGPGPRHFAPISARPGHPIYHRAIDRRARVFYIDDTPYYSYDGIYYRYVQGYGYEEIAMPADVFVADLPYGASRVYVNNIGYYEADGMWFQPVEGGYMIVERPIVSVTVPVIRPRVHFSASFGF